MATRKTMKTKDFMEFDTIVGFGEKIRAYWEENSRQLIAIGLIICLAAGAAAYWATSARTSARTAHSILNNALTLMSSTAPTDAERAAALREAITLLDTAIENYSRTEAGRAALFYRAQCKNRQSDFTGAVADYTAFLQHGGSMPQQLRPFALENLGYAHEALGNQAEALQWFEKAAQAGRSAALIGAARMHETAGSTEAACAAYQQYLADALDTGYRELAEMKVQTLCR
jgi:predicted negative regulator of RcsB-dependent stress response